MEPESLIFLSVPVSSSAREGEANAVHAMHAKSKREMRLMSSSYEIFLGELL